MEFYSVVVNFFQGGGEFMYPIAIVGAIGLAIAIERYVYLTIVGLKNRSLWNDLTPLLAQGDFKRAVALTSKSDAAIGTILNYGLARIQSARRRDDIEKAMDESLLEIIPRMEKRTHYLSALANIGMLTGLLLILALTSSIIPKMLASLRARRQTPIIKPIIT